MSNLLLDLPDHLAQVVFRDFWFVQTLKQISFRQLLGRAVFIGSQLLEFLIILNFFELLERWVLVAILDFTTTFLVVRLEGLFNELEEVKVVLVARYRVLEKLKRARLNFSSELLISML